MNTFVWHFCISAPLRGVSEPEGWVCLVCYLTTAFCPLDVLMWLIPTGGQKIQKKELPPINWSHILTCCYGFSVDKKKKKFRKGLTERTIFLHYFFNSEMYWMWMLLRVNLCEDKIQRALFPLPSFCKCRFVCCVFVIFDIHRCRRQSQCWSELYRLGQPLRNWLVASCSSWGFVWMGYILILTLIQLWMSFSSLGNVTLQIAAKELWRHNPCVLITSQRVKILL